jgi:hypothetical protein
MTSRYEFDDGTVVPAFSRGTLMRGPEGPGRFWVVQTGATRVYCSQDSLRCLGPLDLIADALD